MQNSRDATIVSLVATAAPIAKKLSAVAKTRMPIAFSHVIEPAQALLVAAIASEVRHTLWVVCPSVRSQELLHESLLNWLPDAMLLPEAEFAAVENILPDPEIAAERLALLTLVERRRVPHVIVATRASLNQAAPKPGVLQSGILQLKQGSSETMESSVNHLAEAGYERVAQVATRGQFAVRGGILDLFSWQAQLPVRIEFIGDEIESLREFDVDTQTSVRSLRSFDVLLGSADDLSGRVRDYIGKDHLRIAVEPEEGDDAEIQISESWIDSATRHPERSRGIPLRTEKITSRDPSTPKAFGAPDDSTADLDSGAEDYYGAFQDCEVGEFAVGDFMLAEAKRAQFSARLKEWQAASFRIVIYFQTEGEIERFREIMSGAKGALGGVELLEGTLARGFCFPDGNLVVLSGAELFGRFPTHGRRRLQRAERLGRNRAQIDFSELIEGDPVVHLEHGVGRFLQLTRVPAVGGGMQEVLVLEFADEAKLYVPLEQAYLVSRYVGVGKKSPPLSSLADARWARAKKNAAASIFDYAGKMLAVQAERETQPGHAFGPDTKWQMEFEHSFPYRETPDQSKAIITTKRDMEQSRSMDRLICGDVGFGKTEVAIRAAFKAVMEGKQVAMLAPTTVLAQQHFETFRQRMLDYPVRIEMLSRFRSHAEQRKVLELLRDGGVD
ncbi:MAG: CarD family transcriptional regulator, partial [Verrucomicrobiota bacterium]